MADKSETIQNRLSTLQYNHTAISADTGNKQQQFRAHSIKLAWSLSEKDWDNLDMCSEKMIRTEQEDWGRWKQTKGMIKQHMVVHWKAWKTPFKSGLLWRMHCTGSQQMLKDSQVLLQIGC